MVYIFTLLDVSKFDLRTVGEWRLYYTVDTNPKADYENIESKNGK